jgi:acetyl esterase/lipase
MYTPPGTLDPEGYAWPLHTSSLRDLPPTIVGAAEYDVLRDAAVQFATRLWAESKNGCELHVNAISLNL